MNPEASSSPRLESYAFYIFLAAVVLAPLVFLPTPYLTLDLIKTVVIAAGTLLAAILLFFGFKKERRFILPPKGILWAGVLVVVSILISAATSSHFVKSFFGQGFEVHTASFLLLLFVAAYVCYLLVRNHPERAIILYVGAIISFFILTVFHVLRFIFGADFATFSILNTLTSTVFGSWYELAIYALLVGLIALTAVLFLPLPRRLMTVYSIIVLISFAAAFLINNSRIWFCAAAILLGLTIYQTYARSRTVSGLLKKIAWLPLALFVISALLYWKGTVVAGPIINKINAAHFEPTLPWDMTLDVVSGAVKDNPLFGVGPNRFANAFIAYKPALINATPFWNVEFATGFGRIPSFLVTQGLIGSLLWLVFFVFLGINIFRAVRSLPTEPHARFIIMSSSVVTVFLWLTNLVYTPSHTLFFYTLMFSGISLGSSVAYGSLKDMVWMPAAGSRMYKYFPSLCLLVIVIGILWGAMYIKKSASLGYFASGVRKLTVANDTTTADKSFKRALAIDRSDIYWQAQAEIGQIKVGQMTASIPTGVTPAADLVTKIGEVITESMTAARNAIEYDPTNYYNYVSEARVSEMAARLGIANAYENAVNAYGQAIGINPSNPGLYLNLARLHAAQNKPNEAIQAIGASLQIKNNYIESIFLLSQIEAARGNLKDAIIAARVATELNPQSPILFLQLGLLQYNNKEYGAAVESLTKAVALQPDYANAKYFLGLSYSRLGRNAEAIIQFEDLAQTNSDNQEVALILSNLKAGRSAFVDAKPPITPTPEKRTNLPLRERQR